MTFKSNKLKAPEQLHDRGCGDVAEGAIYIHYWHVVLFSSYILQYYFGTWWRSFDTLGCVHIGAKVTGNAEGTGGGTTHSSHQLLKKLQPAEIEKPGMFIFCSITAINIKLNI